MKIKFFILSSFFTGTLFLGCSSKHIPGETGSEAVNQSVSAFSIPVSVQTVSMQSFKNEISISGNIEGNKTVRLGFLVAGKLNFIAVEEGGIVQANKLLASLDPANYIIAREIADANLDQAQDDYNRVSLMYQKKSIAESDFTKVTNALKAARAQQHLQAKNLDDTKLFSPITGVLLKKGTEVGEIVGTGIPVFVVSDIRTVKVNASIPESELHNIHMGGEAHVYIASLNSTCTGKVSEIGSLADAETRSFTVKIVLNNEGMHIRPGMTAEIIIPSGKVSSALLIPLESVLHETDQSVYVFVADKNLKMAYHRKISIGKIEGNNVEVLSGLNAGETIITQAQQKLSNGSLISIK